MKFSIQSKNLLSQMASVGKVVNSKSAIAILSNFLLELRGDVLTVVGSDQDIVMGVDVQVFDAEGAGKFCIDAKKLIELLKVVPDGLVTFDVNITNLAVIIRYANGQYDLMARPGDDYPIDLDKSDAGEVASFEMPAEQVAQCLSRVSFAVGTDDLRPQMQGVLWDVREDAIIFVATDTRQLARYRSTRTAPGKECRFILPTKAVRMLDCAIGKEAIIKVSVGTKCVQFSDGNFSLTSVLTRGAYPNYERVIPRDNNKVLIIDRGDFLNAVRRVSICADTQNNLIKMAISSKNILITSQDPGYSMGGKECVPCEYNGDDMFIGFSASYLSDMLNTIGTANVIIRLGGNMRPGLFLPAEDDEFGELTLLCMPMNID